MTANKKNWSVPLDLGEWIPSSQLSEWILSDVATLDWINPELLDLLRQQPEFEPKALLNTMTLAYATGVFGAEEIARQCSGNPDFRAVRPKLPPLAAEMQQFRKENRGVFKWCLARVITRALKAQFTEGSTMNTLPPGVRRLVIENAIERLDIARHIDRSAGLL